MQPYQQANEEIRKHGEFPIKAAGTAASIATGAATYGLGSSLFKRIMPLLSQYVPEDLAKKGLEKINPGFGEFISKAESEGYDFSEIKDFIKQKGEKTEERENVKDNRNIIEQYSPNLFQYLQGMIKNGSTPTEAGANAKKFLDKKHQNIINQIEKDHKTDWNSIVQSVFGQGTTPNQPQQMQQQQPQQGQPSQGQGGQGQAALMAMLDKINQKLGQ